MRSRFGQQRQFHRDINSTGGRIYGAIFWLMMLGFVLMGLRII